MALSIGLSEYLHEIAVDLLSQRCWDGAFRRGRHPRAAWRGSWALLGLPLPFRCRGGPLLSTDAVLGASQSRSIPRFAGLAAYRRDSRAPLRCDPDGRHARHRRGADDDRRPRGTNRQKLADRPLWLVWRSASPDPRQARHRLGFRRRGPRAHRGGTLMSILLTILLSVLGGALLSVQATVNGRLGAAQGAIRATFLTFLVGVAFSAILVIFLEPARQVTLFD